ncbi:unnamed protein product [Acanthoscelides obtectus]|nr:unnamed protein product [Acanthoscelides obtectus]CAK1666322.1 Bloom syndrome protein homolog [Acanthoscelides obtectus]
MVIMENADDDAFASLPIATKKFQFKKVEKSSSLASKSNTTSPFFKKIQQKSSERDKVYTLPRNVIPNNFEADPLKEKLENLFNDEEAPESHKKSKARISNSQKISIGHNTFKKSSTPNSYTNSTLKESTNEKVAQLCGTSSGIETISNKLSNKIPVKRFTPLKKDSNEMKSQVAPIFNFHKAKKKDSVDDKPCFPTSISSSSHSSKSRLQDSKNTPESCTKNASKFHFKKKTVVGVPKESLVDLFCDSQSFTDSRTTNYDTGVTFSVEETNEVKSPVVCSSTSNKFKDNDPEKVKHICDNVKIINIEDNRHVSSSSAKLKDTRQDTELFDLSEKDKQKKLVFKKGSSSSGSSTPDLSPVKSSLNKKQVSPKISKPLLHQEDGSSSADTTTIKPKKFVFKKLTSSSGCSTPSLSLSPKKSSLNKKEESPKSNKYLHKSVNFVKHDSHISISSDDFDDTPVKSTKTTNVSKKVLLDDEVQFISQSLQTTQADYMDDEEFERLFGEGSKPTEPQASNIPADDFDLSDINWSEKIDTPVKESDILADISDVNWSEDIFAQESYTPPDAFKDRVDDAAEFKGHYHFSDTMDEVLHQKFGLREFRPQQREIINACLNRHDCFVLMPTGGGKSLCYQLPAVLSEGVTIVISPLRALISDQVDKLNALDICSAHLCSDVSREDSTMVFSKLHCREPLIKLLYLTPEKINASMAVADLLKSLYQRGKLARVVIDEAHCLSQWGHDFRPDYKQLYKLREQFRDVPIMCLTATATKHVETDVINTLKLTKVKRFIMSFNRPNIKYQVIPKTGKFATAEIIKLIRSKFYKKSGIIYCLARNDCDTIAEQLNRQGIMTRPYHAGMNDKIREAIQREWMQDRFYVIVATIAFGMGIDKPDVRFVIHNSIPKSVEAFYQESGRAGRDGEISYSYLFYNYTDVLRLQKIMQMEKANRKTMDGHNNNLRQMVSFAENVVDCRRHLQLLHLGENFDRNICIRNKGTTCDNCENINRYKEVDVTKEARELGTLVKDLSVRDVTMIQIADTYKGSKAKLIVDRR